MADEEDPQLTQGAGGQMVDPSTIDQVPEQTDAPKAIPVDPDEEYQDKVSNTWKQFHERSEYYRTKMDAIAKHFESQTQDISKMGQGAPQMQKLPTFDEYQAQHGGQQGGNGVATKLMALVVTIAVAAAMFGRKHSSGYAQGAVMSGLGAMFGSIAKGQKDQFHDNYTKWHSLVEEMGKENSERLANYRSVLADKRLDLQQQMDLMNTYSKMYADDRMEEATAQKDLKAVQQNLENKRKFQERYFKDTTKAFSSGQYQEWRMLVRQKSHGEVDPGPAGEHIEEAMQVYPYSTFLEDKREAGKDKKDASGKVVGKEKYSIDEDKGTGNDSPWELDLPNK